MPDVNLSAVLYKTGDLRLVGNWFYDHAGHCATLKCPIVNDEARHFCVCPSQT